MPERALVEELDRIVESLLAGSEPGASGGEMQALAEIAGVLRDLPSEPFKTRLKADLERSSSMSVASAATARGGFRAITPFIIHERAPELVEFLKTAFRAEELKRDSSGQAYGFYSEVRIGDSVVMIGGGAAAQRGNLPSALHVYVDDCDAAYRRALDAGAVTLMGKLGEPADRSYGERSGFVEDAFGNYWYIATRFPSTAARENFGAVLPFVHPRGARKYIEFLKNAFGAEEMMVVEQAGRVMHAAVRVGDAVLEMGEPDDSSGLPSNGFFLWVENVQATYARAIEAGATSVRPPSDIPYGLNSAIVRDPAGYLWWPARWNG